eukprot:ANDGO_07432.mRNA.1 hypothetical protein
MNPEGHEVHNPLDKLGFATFPASHATHADWLSMGCIPAGQGRHDDKEEDPLMFDHFPVGQKVHAGDPDILAKDPGRHCKQRVLSGAATVPTGQAEHLDTEDPLE